MRILYFSRDYTTHDRRFLAKISEQHEVFFLRLEDDGVAHEQRPVPDGVRVVPWAAGRDRFTTPESWLRLVPAYQKVVEEVRPDLVHAGPVQSCGFMTALVDFHPFLLMSWGSDILVDANRDDFWRWITRFAIDRSDMLLCDCAEVSKKVQDRAGYQEIDIVRFPWGVDPSKFYPGESSVLRNEDGWRDAAVVISTRAWREDYGTQVLLDAFRLAHKREPRLRLALLGDGPLASVIRTYVAQHGLRGVVQLPGLLPEDELPEYFRSADVYLSCAPSDGSSISLLEAIASGLPVVVSDRPSNREWVGHHDTGWLAEAGDPESFARALVEAARLEPNRRRQIAATNRQIALRAANWDHNVTKLLAAYERLNGMRAMRDVWWLRRRRVPSSMTIGGIH